MTDIRSFRLPTELFIPLRRELSQVAMQVITAITAEVPAYAEAFTGEMGAKIERAVRAALTTFLSLVTTSTDSPMAAALEAAYALGRGEARSGRSLDALLAAYRVGARVTWREFAAISVREDQQAALIARFAEVIFVYIDELSGASVAGHADELATSGRVRRRHLERLAQALIAGEPEIVVRAAAERADWTPPGTLTAVLVPERTADSALDLLTPGTLLLADAGPSAPAMSVLLIPDARRPYVLRLLRGQRAVVGPSRAWLDARTSFERAVRARLVLPQPVVDAVLDTDDHLAALVVSADPQALADLRERVLAPLAGEREPAATKLAETLRSWLLHQGRREAVADELFVHPQTVRYRMTRLRELYGDRLRDPEWLTSLTIALGPRTDPG